jgi:hypothetical protein
LKTTRIYLFLLYHHHDLISHRKSKTMFKRTKDSRFSKGLGFS